MQIMKSKGNSVNSFGVREGGLCLSVSRDPSGAEQADVPQTVMNAFISTCGVEERNSN